MTEQRIAALEAEVAGLKVEIRGLKEVVMRMDQRMFGADGEGGIYLRVRNLELWRSGLAMVWLVGAFVAGLWASLAKK